MSRNLCGEKAVVRNSDMDESMQSLAVELASAAVEKYNLEKDIASYIKKEFDRRYGPTWHCVVGRNFGRTEGAQARTQMLNNFFVTSPWSDGRSLIAKWTWSLDADLDHFEKASEREWQLLPSRVRRFEGTLRCMQGFLCPRGLMAGPLDEGFERTEIITQPINSFTLQNLRPETTYFICLRVHHRLQSRRLSQPTAHTTTSTATTQRTSINWHVRQPSKPVSPDNYAYEVRCTQATTQNWHLSALIGGILGVVFALVLGFLLLFVLKRNKCLPSGSSGIGKQMTQRSLLGNSYNQRGGSSRRGRRSSSKRGSFHSSLWPSRSSNSRSEFSGHLREEDEDDEDDDDEVITEDDEEDTEIDTGGKSSVRSQAGIYGGSGGTTGSSNRHSSMSSSIDAREDSSSFAMPYLPVNGVQARMAGRRPRDTKSSSGGYEIMKNISGVKVNVVAPSPDVSDAREDLRKASPTPIKNTVDRDRREVELSAISPTVIPNLPDPLRGSPISALRSPLVSSPPPLSKSSLSTAIESDSRGDCQSPVPLVEPQPVELQTPLVGDVWIESPKVEAISQLLPEIPCTFYDNEEETTANDDPDCEPSLSLSDATLGSSRESIVSSNYDYEVCRYFTRPQKFEGEKHRNPGRQGLAIYTEFVETI